MTKEQQTFNLKKLAELTYSKLVGDSEWPITGVADLETATKSDAAFFSNPLYRKALNCTQAGVIFVDLQADLVEGKNYLLSKQPSLAFQIVIDLFHPKKQHPTGFQGIHPTAVIHPSVHLSEHVCIGPHAVLDEGVKVGRNTFIGAGTSIGLNTEIGQECLIYPNVTIREDCVIGNYVIIQPGAVIGSCGFGYTFDQGKHVKLNQVGNVRIEDHVEIGANTTIDRARFKSTVINKGTKIDNLVQLAHGVELGAHNLIIAQTGIAGSTSTGDYVILAGQVAVAGHVRLADGVQVAAKSGVTHSLLEKGQYGGFPAIELKKYWRNQVLLKNIEKYIDLIKKLVSR